MDHCHWPMQIQLANSNSKLVERRRLKTENLRKDSPDKMRRLTKRLCFTKASKHSHLQVITSQWVTAELASVLQDQVVCAKSSSSGGVAGLALAVQQRVRVSALAVQLWVGGFALAVFRISQGGLQ